MSFNSLHINTNKRQKPSNTFRLNSEFSFKDKYDSHNNSNSKNNKTAGNFHLKIKVDKSTKGIEKIVNKYSALKSSHTNLNSISLAEKDHYQKKEEEINRLNEYIQEYTTANDELKYQITTESGIRSDLEHEQKSISDYCNDLKKKFANIEKTIEDYEQTVSRIKNENFEIQESYEKKIDEMQRENKHLATRLEDRIKTAKYQVNTIRELELRSEIVLKETEEQKAVFLEKQMMDKIRYDELEKKYAALQKKIYEYQMNHDIRKAEMSPNSRKNSLSRDNPDDVDIKINNYERSNQDLIKSINDLTTQLTDFQFRESQKEFEVEKSKLMTVRKNSSTGRYFNK